MRSPCGKCTSRLERPKKSSLPKTILLLQRRHAVTSLKHWPMSHWHSFAVPISSIFLASYSVALPLTMDENGEVEDNKYNCTLLNGDIDLKEYIRLNFI